MPITSSVFVTEPSVVFREDLNQGGVLYNPGTDRAFSVNNLGARIWTMLQTGSTLDELIVQLQVFFSPPPDTLRDDVHAYLLSLLSNQLIREQ